jgi:hypothetical protein
MLASVDREALSSKDRVRLLQARNRLAAHVQGELYADLYAISRAEPVDEQDSRDPEQPYPWATAEIAFALTWTHTAATIRLDQAMRMIEDLPMVQAALAAGRIDVPKALVLCDEVCVLDSDVARGIVERLIDKAPEWTTGQLRARLRRLVLAADPQAALRQAKVKSTGRGVAISQEHSNLASIAGYDLLPHRVAASWERLTAIARAAKSAGDPRRMDELRADAMMDLLIGEGIAVGGPITNGDLRIEDHNENGGQEHRESSPTDGQPEPGSGATSQQPASHSNPAPGGQPATEAFDGDAPWPTAPADPDLLNPAADPAVTDPVVGDGARPAQPEPVPVEPAAEAAGDPSVDPEDERLRPYWLAGFDQLSRTRPGSCPHCAQTTARGPMPGPRRGVIDLQMSLDTLMGLDDLPAELAGFGPLLADIARQIVAERPDLQLRYSVYDEIDALIAHGTTNVRPPPGAVPTGRRTKRRPSAQVAAWVRARNRTCMAPGCRVPSSRCELDHTVAWVEDGESEPDNLGPGCPRHHRLKHSPGCQLIQFSPGTFGWQTPLGMQYMTKPDPPLYDDHRYLDPVVPDDPAAP